MQLLAELDHRFWSYILPPVLESSRPPVLGWNWPLRASTNRCGIVPKSGSFALEAILHFLQVGADPSWKPHADFNCAQMENAMPTPRVSLLLLVIIVAMAVSGCVQTSVGVRVGDPPLPAHPPYASPAMTKGPPPWAPAHGMRAKYDYRYYPQAAVYRDDARGLWFYYEDGEWTAGANLPVSISINVSDYVTVSMDTDTPHLHHDEVSKHYPPGQTTAKHNKWKKNRYEN